MKCQADIEILAREKIKDAECLFKNKRYDAAYYLAGYSIELLLKAKICKTLGIADLFDFDNTNKKLNVDGNLNRSFRVHNYDQLIILSGLYTALNKELSKIKFKGHWSLGQKIPDI